jgi:aminocarboxymuconate-semialdehyde decarboxylase
MDEQSIDKQVVGGWLDSFGYELPAEEGEAWSRFMNEFQMTGTDNIDRLYPLATVPLQDGNRAAKVLEEAMADGFKGVMIGTQPKGGTGNLDDVDLDPFWEAASSLGATIYLHPMFGCGDPRLNDFALMNAVGRGTDTTTAVSRLLFSGHLLKYSGMKFVLSHGGGAIPFMMGRLAKNYEIHPGQYSDPVASFRKLYFDTVLFAPDALKFLCSSCGHERVMLGSDYPFPIGDMTPLKVIDEACFTDQQRNMIVGKTAAKLFGIS